MLHAELRLVLVFVLAAAAALAQGKGRGGGGGNEPPPDPAIAYIDLDVEVMDADGSNATTLRKVGRREEARGPSWSPDGRQLVVGGTLDGAFGIHIVQVDGSGTALAVPLSSPSQPVPFPDWSPAPAPDGRDKLAFDARPVGSEVKDVWIANPDGSGVVNLTNTPNAYEIWPAFSRDGSHIAFVRSSSQGYQLVVAQLGLVNGELAITSELVGYTSPGGILAFPSWARTQDLIVVSEMRNGLLRLVILDAFGTPGIPVVLTAASGGDERWGSFAPDDSSILFHRGGPGGGILMCALDGSNEVRVSRKGYDPAWRR